VKVVQAKPSFPLEHAEALSQCQIASLRRPKAGQVFTCWEEVAIDFAICIENEQVDFRPDLEYAGLRG
jgi:hypothetical protein